jgi:choline monooxygenase
MAGDGMGYAASSGPGNGAGLPESDLAQVLKPIAEARGLPNACYLDDNYCAFERDAVFARTWMAIGFGKDVAAPGDAVPVDVLGLPLLLLRDRKGVVRVFHNVCSHRGMRLVEESTQIKGVIRCPYHSWCYGLNGELRATPSIGGAGVNEIAGFDRRHHGLREVRSALWMDLVFVNLSGEAPAFDTHIAPLAGRWKEFLAAPLHHGGDDSGFALTVNCNWKLAVENYCESYHLPWVHPGLNSYSRLEDHYDIRVEAGAGFSGQGTRVYRPILSETGETFPQASGLSSQWDSGAEYVSLFPNALLGVHKDHFFAIALLPQGAEATLERIEIYYFQEAARSDAFAGLRQINTRLWRQVFAEDVFAVEGMQRGRRSPGFTGGVFSPVMDGPTHDFHVWMATRLGAAAHAPMS